MMNDAADVAEDSERQSRRERWRDAISKTKNKFKKEKVDESQGAFKLSEDVNDFLAAGRKASATITARQVVDQFSRSNSSPQPSTSGSLHSGRVSPRGIPVPRLDVSQSQRWPDARQLNTNSRPRSNDHLSPDSDGRHNSARSRSFSSALVTNRKKSRGLSVSFMHGPPIVIGEGGDMAEAPPLEISRFRERSRSLSPYPDRPVSKQSNSSNSRSPVRRKPIPPSSPPPPVMMRNEDREDSIFQPTPVRRTQTGFSDQEVQATYITRPLEAELDPALRLDGENGFQSTLVDSQHSTSPGSRQDTQRVTNRPTITSGRDMDRTLHIQTSPRSTGQDLQQSRDTSYKVLPPKMHNFYADLARHNSKERVQTEKHPFTYQVHESGIRPQERPQEPFYGQPRPNPTNETGAASRPSRAMSQSASEGWV